MRLNKAKWLQELRRVESDLKTLKGQMRASGHMPEWTEYRRLWSLKAEATRLYVLRRTAKAEHHPYSGSCWILRHKSKLGAHFNGQVFRLEGDIYAQKILVPGVDDGQLDLELILDGVPGWVDQFLLPEADSVPAGLHLSSAAS